MLYLVSPDGIYTDNVFICDDDSCFIVSASDDDELAAAIANMAVESGCYDTDNIDGSEWGVFALGKGFNFKIAAKHIFSGKRN